MAASHNNHIAGIMRLGLSLPSVRILCRRSCRTCAVISRSQVLCARGKSVTLAGRAWGRVLRHHHFAGLSPSGDFNVVELYEEPIQLFVPSNHPMADAKMMVRGDLKNLQVLALADGHPLHARGRLLREARRKANRDFEGTCLDALREMIGTGLGHVPAGTLRARTISRPDQDAARFEMPGKPLCRKYRWPGGVLPRARTLRGIARVLQAIGRAIGLAALKATLDLAALQVGRRTSQRNVSPRKRMPRNPWTSIGRFDFNRTSTRSSPSSGL